jgi:hypothetical protein
MAKKNKKRFEAKPTGVLFIAVHQPPLEQAHWPGLEDRGGATGTMARLAKNKF